MLLALPTYSIDDPVYCIILGNDSKQLSYWPVHLLYYIFIILLECTLEHKEMSAVKQCAVLHRQQPRVSHVYHIS